MKYFENGNVTYLENEDIDDKGNLKFDPKKPAICMVQGLFCGWCSKAKPDFQKFADNHPEIFVCTVQIDGNDSEKQLNSRLSTLINGGIKGGFTFNFLTGQVMYKNYIKSSIWKERKKDRKGFKY